MRRAPAPRCGRRRRQRRGMGERFDHNRAQTPSPAASPGRERNRPSTIVSVSTHRPPDSSAPAGPAPRCGDLPAAHVPADVGHGLASGQRHARGFRPPRIWRAALPAAAARPRWFRPLRPVGGSAGPASARARIGARSPGGPARRRRPPRPRPLARSNGQFRLARLPEFWPTAARRQSSGRPPRWSFRPAPPFRAANAEHSLGLFKPLDKIVQIRAHHIRPFVEKFPWLGSLKNL